MINEVVAKLYSERSRHIEMLVAAYITATGIKPEECRVSGVEQRIGDVYRWYFEHKESGVNA